MRAILQDASGPWWTRAIVSALGVLITATSTLWAHLDNAPLGPDFYVGVALLLVAPILVGRHRVRTVELVAHPGRLEVRRAGLLRQTIAGRSVRGASTSRSEEGITLALHRRDRPEPTLIEVRDEADLKTIRDALGIGHHGFGALSWRTRADGIEHLWSIARVAGALSALVIAAADVLGLYARDTRFLAHLLLALAPAWGLFHLVTRARRPRVWLTPQGVIFDKDADGRRLTTAYADIESAELFYGWLTLHPVDETSPKAAWPSTRVDIVKHSRSGMTRMEASHVLAQIDAALRRARGELATEPSVVGADLLARREGESPRAWIERLEATAQQVKTGGSYRGAMIAESDLWSALENHDAAPDVRAAAARVLARVAPAPALARIDGVLASIRDDDARARIRVAIEPNLERAAEELEELDEVAAHTPRTRVQ